MPAHSPPTPPPPRVRVAIVGSGLSGLSAAYLLTHLEVPGGGEARGGGGGGGGKGAVPAFDVHVFERAPRLGLDSNSISVSDGGGGGGGGADTKSVRVDVPMRSFNSGYYPHLLRLYRRLGIPVRRSDFTYSFATTPLAAPVLPGDGDGEACHADAADDDGEGKPHSLDQQNSRHAKAPSPSLIYNGASGVRGFSVPASLLPRAPVGRRSRHLLSPPSSCWLAASELLRHVGELRAYLATVLVLAASYLWLLLLALWHHYAGHTRDPRHPLARRRFGEWARSHRLSPYFFEGVAVPLFSAVMTAQASSVRDAPVAEVLDYVAATFLCSHYTVATGVHRVERALCERLDAAHNVHVGASVTGVRPGPRGTVEIAYTTTSATAATSTEEQADEHHHHQHHVLGGFHHVIFATQANQTASFVGGYERALRGVADARLRASAHRLAKLAEVRRRLACHRYETSTVINHTDRRLLPPDEADWRDLNLVTPVAGKGGEVARTGAAPGAAHARAGGRPWRFSYEDAAAAADADALEAILVPGKDGRSYLAPARGGRPPSLDDGSFGGGVASQSLSGGGHDLVDDDDNGAKRTAEAGATRAAAAAATPARGGGGARRYDSTKQAEAVVAAASMLGLGPVETQTMATHLLATQLPRQRRPRPSSEPASRHETGDPAAPAPPPPPMLLQTTNALSGLMPSDECVLSMSKFERVVLSMSGKLAQRGLYEWRPAGSAGAAGAAGAGPLGRRRLLGRQRQGGLGGGCPGTGVPGLDDAGDGATTDKGARHQWWWRRRPRFLGIPTRLATDAGRLTVRLASSWLPATRWQLQLGELQGCYSGGGGGGSRGAGGGRDDGGDDDEAGIWACGSWSPGIPLLEGCVASSQLVVGAILARERSRHGWARVVLAAQGDVDVGRRRG